MPDIAITEKKVTASDIARMLSAHHGVLGDARMRNRDTAIIFELPNGTGYRMETRYIDAFVMHMWPSKKFWRWSYEIKVSRADFLKELSLPEKRQFAVEISNEFWFACAPGVAKPAEIPDGCGLMEVRGNKLVKLIAARQREARDLDLIEVASLLRQACNYPLIQDLRWYYAGQELDEKGLAALVEKTIDREVEGRIEEGVEKKLENARIALKHYADEFRKVGIEPPHWMETCHFSNPTWMAPDWIKKQIFPGPTVANLQALQQQITQFAQHVKGMNEDAEHAVKTLTAEIERALTSPKGP